MIRMIRLIAIVASGFATWATDIAVAEPISRDACRIAADGRLAKRGLRLRSARVYPFGVQSAWMDRAAHEAEATPEPIVLNTPDSAQPLPVGETEVWPQASALFPAHQPTSTEAQ
jgi:hypothetical protein